jgi:hypothetical protein
MPCITHPPPQIAAVVSAEPSSSDRAPSFRPVSRASANYIDGAGNMDFSCFYHPIRVRLQLRGPGVRFYREHALSFAYVAGKEKRPVTRKVRQFPGGIHRLNARTVWFTYRNSADCGVGDGKPRCLKSAYGLYLVTDHGRVRHIDPIIQNGGSKY